MNIRALGVFAVVSCFLPFTAAAEVRMPAIFGDHMMIQREARVPVWGTAEAGQRITVTLSNGDNEQRKSTTADDYGNWRVDLDAVEAAGPYTLRIEGDGSSLRFEDVLAGEVWLCGGQSNMEWSVRVSNNAEAEIAAADFPQMRIFDVARQASGDPADDVQGAWHVVTPESIAEFSAVGYYFGRTLHQEGQMPVGLISSNWGGTPVMAWMPPEAIEEAGHDIEEQTGDVGPRTSSALYNGMIDPLTPFAVRGFIWYQGEDDAWRGRDYAPLLREMIAAWRKRFDGPDEQPFLIVQLANFLARSDDPRGDDDWARLRDAQRMVAGDDHNGLAVTIDIGDAGDIHPRNKQDVGRRLALVALERTYGKEIVSQGPTATGASVEGGNVVITFDHAEGLAFRGDAGGAFAVGDAEGNFAWAEARVEGGKVVLSVAGIGEPAIVRYAWQINPPAPLYNSAGLPAVPFELTVE